MGPITSLGVGSGLDLNTLVSQLVGLQRAPLQQMDANARTLQTQVSSYGQVKSLFSSLQDAANQLTSPSLWNQGVASSSNTAAVTVSAGSNPARGSYDVVVEQLATNQTLVTGSPFGASTDLVGAGTLTIELGTWNTSVDDFTANGAATAVDISVEATDTLADVRDKINAANPGVRASLVTDATGVRLALRSVDSGADNGFRIGVDINDPAGIARLGFDPEAGVGSMEHKQAALNSRAVINGITVSSAGNEVTDAIEGATLQLKAVTTTPATVDVSPDTESVKTAITGLAAAYSELAKYIANQTRFDEGSQASGPLQGDSAITGLQRQMRQVLGVDSGASSAFPRLSDIGLELQRDGTIKVNSTKLDAAMADLPELKRAMSSKDTLNPANDGFARRYADLAQNVLSIEGSITTRTEGLRTRIAKIDDDKARLNDRVDQFQQRLVAQYTVMDANVSRLNAINSYLTQQLASLAKAYDK